MLKKTKEMEGCGSTEVKPNLPICISMYALLSLSLSYTTNTTEHNWKHGQKEWHRMFSLNKHHRDTWSGADRGSSVAYASALALVYPAAPSGAT
jgi:hypothetical protein